MGCGASGIAGAMPTALMSDAQYQAVKDRLKRRNSYQFFSKRIENNARKPLQQLLVLFAEGFPNKDGQLDHTGFCRVFSLKRDVYTERLVRIFDLDNSGHIGFREFVFGLAKFSRTSFESKLKFAFRLFDLDGNGTLERHEMAILVREALSCDRTHYGRAGTSGFEGENSKDVKRQLEEVARGKDLKFKEFQMMVARNPNLLPPATILYSLLAKHSARAKTVMDTLDHESNVKLLKSLGRDAAILQKEDEDADFADKPIKPTYSLPSKDKEGDSTPEFTRSKSLPARRMSAPEISEPESPSPQPSPRQTPGWQCTVCTLINSNPDALECEACQALPPSQVLQNRGAQRAAQRIMQDSNPLYASSTTPSPPSRHSISSINRPPLQTPLAAVDKRSPPPARRSLSRSFNDTSTSGEVSLFLDRHGLKQYADAFRQSEVFTMDTLSLMTDKDLREVGLAKGPRVKILDLLNQMKNGRLGTYVGDVGVPARKEPTVSKDQGPSMKCKICMDAEVQVCLQPCGHTFLCLACARECQNCPLCRTEIKGTVKCFMA